MEAKYPSVVPVEIFHYIVLFRGGVILFGTQHESNFQTFSHTLPRLSLVGQTQSQTNVIEPMSLLSFKLHFSFKQDKIYR